MQKVNEDILKSMKITRELASQGLLLRQKADTKVRQPLQSLSITEKIGNEYVEILKDELNVKEILFGKEISLNVNITEDLKQEGNYRELLRAVQEMRKEQNLEPHDMVILSISNNTKELLEMFGEDLKKKAGIKEINFNDGQENIVDVEDFVLSFMIHKS